MADINQSLLEALDGKGPQTKKAGSEAFQWWEGRNGAGYVEILGADGTPITQSNPMPTTLTGRNVEELIPVNGVTVLAGSSYYNDGDPDVSKYVNARALVYSSESYDLILYQVDSDGNYDVNTVELASAAPATGTDRFADYNLSEKMPSIKLHFLYRNNGSVDATLSLKIHGLPN